MLEWDQEAARTADLYIANSTSVAARILKVYGRKPEVLFPPVCVNVDGPQEPMDGSESPFFVAVSRPRAYKGIEALANAFRRLPRHRLYIVGRRTIDNCPDNVRALGTVSDSRLRWLYANARGLISVSLEDFGLTPLEANAFGTPALLLRAGGFLDSLDEGISGSYIEEISEESIVDAVNRFPVEWDRNLIRSHAQRFSAREFERKMTELVKSVIGRKSGHVQ
jgi:glycosyltransferase involved in cell wall biosynthesis